MHSILSYKCFEDIEWAIYFIIIFILLKKKLSTAAMAIGRDITYTAKILKNTY